MKQSIYDEWLDGVSDALCISPPRLQALWALRHCGDTLAPTPTADYPPRAARFQGGQRKGQPSSWPGFKGDRAGPTAEIPGNQAGRGVGLARAADSVRRRGQRSPLNALVEFNLQFWLGDRRIVAEIDRRRACWLANVGDDALNWGDIKASAFLWTAAVEIRGTDVGSGSEPDHPEMLVSRPVRNIYSTATR